MLEFFILPYVACLNFNSIFNPPSPPPFMQIWPFKPILKVGQGGMFLFLPERINCVQDETLLPIVWIFTVFI